MTKYSDELNYSIKKYQAWCKANIESMFGHTLRIIFKDGQYIAQIKEKILFMFPIWCNFDYDDDLSILKDRIYARYFDKIRFTGFKTKHYMIYRSGSSFFIPKLRTWNVNILNKIYDEFRQKYNFGIIQADRTNSRQKYLDSEAPEVLLHKDKYRHITNEVDKHGYEVVGHRVFEVVKRYAEMLEDITIESQIQLDLKQTL